MRCLIFVISRDPRMPFAFRQLGCSRRVDLRHVDNLVEARREFSKWLPHAVLIGTGFQHVGSWLETLKAETGVELPTLEFGPLDAPFARRFRKFVHHLRRNPTYKRVARPGERPLALLDVEGRITGVSETGFCVQSEVSQSTPFRPVGYVTDFFQANGLSHPLLQLVNTDALPENGEASFANYFQILGWNEVERKALRKWIWDHRLTPRASA